MTRKRLDELDRLREMAHDRLGMIGRVTATMAPEARFKTIIAAAGSPSGEVHRLLRSIRQIIVLEF